ncbi:cohesin domain-containing protein [Edaphobacter aggregans]|uniref:cohesin domain-containing protein n=1 Tax=Edaphobacter aggregans TaxID=570835 RepID=UPI000558D681|nr:cohesin domain-containing protein [Edaphobacter aggregans]
MKLGRLFLLTTTFALLAHTAARADAVLSVVPYSSAVTAGQQFTVGIYVTGPTVIHNGQTITSNVTDLSAFQFDLAFNCLVAGGNSSSCAPGAGILNAVSVTEGPFLPNGGTNPTFFESGTIDNTAGTISSIGDVGLSGVTGSGYLVNITFQALQAGTTSIAILANSDLQFYDSNFNPIVIDDSVTTSPGQQTFPTNQSLSTNVTVAPVPEPPSLQLLLIGGSMTLVTLLGSRRLSAQH